MLDKKVQYEYKHSEKKTKQLRNNQMKNLKKKIKKLNISENELTELIALAS